MKCPACDNVLTPITAGGMTVDACKGGCGGIWFDRFELGKLNESSQSAGDTLLHIERKPAIQADSNQRPKLKCPKCGMIMMRNFFNAKKQFLVDACPGCAGTWLDAGELAKIQAEFKASVDRKKAAEQ